MPQLKMYIPGLLAIALCSVSWAQESVELETLTLQGNLLERFQK